MPLQCRGIRRQNEVVHLLRPLLGQPAKAWTQRWNINLLSSLVGYWTSQQGGVKDLALQSVHALLRRLPVSPASVGH